ncbi:MAG: pantoate--beta-alanine ligase, partial [Gammaproteobacteria bacterium SHHR-1]
SLASRVVVSIFVNPLQFGPQEDFASYPRTLQADRELLQAQGADLLFAPPVEQVYPQGQQGHTQVEVPDISAQLCGASRPGHFSGVATVVCKLLNLVRPQLALFGEKDYQQLLVIRRMVADLALPVQIIGVPTVREADGLALSSRNRYLSTEQRQQAPRLYRTLCWLAEGLKAGAGDFALLEQEACARLSQAGFQPDYVSIRRSQDLAPAGPQDHSLRLLAAAQLGQARLIDNLRLVLTAES